MIFSLKLQRDNRKNALAVEPAKGKTGKKLYFSTHCGDETTTYFNRAFLYLDGSRSGTLWEHAESTPSRSAGRLKPMALKGALNRLIRGWAAPWKRHRETSRRFVLALSWHMVVSSPQYGESTDVFSSFPSMGSILGTSYWLFHDGAFKNHRQPIAGVRKGGIGWGGRAPLHRKGAPFLRHYGFLLSFPSYAVTFSHGTGYSP